MSNHANPELIIIDEAKWERVQRVRESRNPENTKKYVRKDGSVHVNKYPIYRCSGKGLQKVKCSGQTTHSQKKLEGMIIEEVKQYLNKLETIDLTTKVRELRKNNTASEIKEIQMLKQKLVTEQTKLTKLKEEIIKVIMGDSHFTSELLTGQINVTEEGISTIQEKITQIEEVLESKRIEQQEVDLLRKYIPEWVEVFEDSSIAKKKMMLR